MLEVRANELVLLTCEPRYPLRNASFFVLDRHV